MNFNKVNRRSKTIYVYKGGELVATYPMMSQAARDLGIKVQNIWKVLNGYKSTLNGLEFRYEKDEV